MTKNQKLMSLIKDYCRAKKKLWILDKKNNGDDKKGRSWERGYLTVSIKELEAQKRLLSFIFQNY